MPRSDDGRTSKESVSGRYLSNLKNVVRPMEYDVATWSLPTCMDTFFRRAWSEVSDE